jgi:hypothetical protein
MEAQTKWLRCDFVSALCPKNRPARRKSSDEVPISYLSPTLEITRLTVAMILSGSQKAFSVIAILPTSL